MRVAIDKAGRLVIPKPIREELALSPGTVLEIEVIDSRLELSVPNTPAALVEGPHGPSLAAGGAPLDDEQVRRVLETTRRRM